MSKEFNLAAHDCSTCKASGACPLEPIVVYFKGKEEEHKQVLASIEKLLSSSWAVMMGALVEDVHISAVTTVMMGYIMGKGVEVETPNLDKFFVSQLKEAIKERRYFHDN